MRQIIKENTTLQGLYYRFRSFPQIGLLSIDVDGNDDWFLKALIDTSPTVISVEYKSTLGMEPIAIPCDPSFGRHRKHPEGLVPWRFPDRVDKVMCATRPRRRFRRKLQRVFYPNRQPEAERRTETQDGSRTVFRNPK